MTVLIKNARIVDPLSPFHQTTQDLLIESGIITKIGKITGSPEARTVESSGLHVSPGWVDIFANFCDPGYEFKETLESGAAAAAGA